MLPWSVLCKWINALELSVPHPHRCLKQTQNTGTTGRTQFFQPLIELLLAQHPVKIHVERPEQLVDNAMRECLDTFATWAVVFRVHGCDGITGAMVRAVRVCYVGFCGGPRQYPCDRDVSMLLVRKTLHLHMGDRLVRIRSSIVSI